MFSVNGVTLGMFWILSVLLISAVENVHISLPNGNLAGFVNEDRNGDKFFAFKAIPYAKPPIGELRFKKSIKADPWEGTLDATKDSEMCIQPDKSIENIVGNEDCLYLNVYTKNLNASNPVVVYVHGGAWNIGSNLLDPSYLMTENIVLVLMNYRLGALGFLNAVGSDIDDDISPNNGYKDQILAIEWVIDNVKYFGGNATQITLMGESAGAMSIHALLLSPLLPDLPFKAILMSGTSLVAMHPTFNNTAKMIAEVMGINATNPQEMADNLRNANLTQLHQAQLKLDWFKVQLNTPNYGALVVEKPGPNSLIDDYCIKLIKSNKLRKIPLLLGYDNAETLILKVMSLKGDINDWNLHMPFFFENQSDVLEKIKIHYNISEDKDETKYFNFLDDIWFKYNIFRTAKEHASRQQDDIYFYEFSFDGNLNMLKNQHLSLKKYPGACHADDLGYLFKFPHDNDTLTNEDKSTIELMVKAVSNFATYGKPFGDSWKSFNSKSFNFANITNDGFMFDTLPTTNFDFWDNIYRIHNPNDNY